MAKKIILKPDDISIYRKISPNYDSTRFNSFALTIQETQLRELLGDALYKALYDDLDVNGDPQSSPFIELVNGEDYTYSGNTIEYFGIKPYMSYHWLKLSVREGDLFHSDYGNINFSDNPQDNMIKLSGQDRDRITAAYGTFITSYRNNIVQYLNNKGNTFSTWITKDEDISKTQFNIITV
jgi:hypothetical protein